MQFKQQELYLLSEKTLTIINKFISENHNQIAKVIKLIEEQKTDYSSLEAYFCSLFDIVATTIHEENQNGFQNIKNNIISVIRKDLFYFHDNAISYVFKNTDTTLFAYWRRQDDHITAKIKQKQKQNKTIANIKIKITPNTQDEDYKKFINQFITQYQNAFYQLYLDNKNHNNENQQ